MTPTSKAALRTCAGLPAASVALLVMQSLTAPRARGHDLALDQEVGRIGVTGTSVTPYVSRRIEGAVDLGDDWQFTVAFNETHFFSTRDFDASEAYRCEVEGYWDVSDRLSFVAQGYLLPTSTRVATEQASATSDLASARIHGAGLILSGDYELAPDADFDTTLGASVAATDYETLLRFSRPLAQSSSSDASASMVQWRFDARASEEFFKDSEVDLAASYFAYQQFSLQSHRYDPMLFGQLTLSAINPVEPLRAALRATLAQRFSSFRISLSGQLGRYVDHEGFSEALGLRVQLKLTRAARASLAGNLQREMFSSGDRLSIASLHGAVQFIF